MWEMFDRPGDAKPDNEPSVQAFRGRSKDLVNVKNKSACSNITCTEHHQQISLLKSVGSLEITGAIAVE